MSSVLTEPTFSKLELNSNFLLKFTDLDQFVEALRQTCTMKVKANAVKQEYEKQDELKRSALKAYAALSNIPKAGKCCQMNNLSLSWELISF